MSKSSKIVLGVIVVVLVVLIATLSKNSPTDVIKIGYIGPSTGPVAGTAGEDVSNGWKIAVQKRPMLAGKKVDVIYEDDACTPQKAVAAVQKLINVDKVKIVVNGVCSGSMVSEAPVTEQNKVILFTPVSTSPKITDAGDYVFRTSATASHTSQALVKYLNSFGYKSIAILFENVEYPVGIKDTFLPLFLADSTHSVVATEGITSQDTDIRSQLLKLTKGKPQALVVLMNSSATANSFIKQLTDLNIKLPVLGNEYFAFDVVVKNPSADGVYATQYKYDQNSPALVSYLDEYKKIYGKVPSQDIYASLPFDGYNVLANAIEACKNDNPDCVKDELYKVKGYQGITGVITIDEKGDTSREFTLRKISGGKLIDVQ